MPRQIIGMDLEKCPNKQAMDAVRRSSYLLKDIANSRLTDPPTPETGEPRLAEATVGRPENIVRPRFVRRNVENEEDEENALSKEDLLENMEEQDSLSKEYVLKDLKKEKRVLFEWLGFILIIVALICSFTLSYLRELKPWEIGLWKWLVLALVVISGRLLSVWIFKIVIFSFERNLLFGRRVSFFVYDARKKVQNCFWLGLVSIAWLYLFDEKIAEVTRSRALGIVSKLLASLLVCKTLWLATLVSVNVLASNFYTSTYFKRILDSIFSQYIMEALSGPPLTEIQKKEEEERNAEEDRNVQNVGATIPTALRGASPFLSGKQPFKKGHKKHQGITIELLHRLTPENVSAWNMQRLMNMVRHGALSTLEQIQDNNARVEPIEIRSEFEAEVVAEKIFRNVAEPGSRYIFLKDLTRFMREVEASRTQSLLNGGFKSEKISLRALKNWVVGAFEERRLLGLTLNDYETIVSRVHGHLNVLVSIAILVIGLVLLGIKNINFSNSVLFVISLRPLYSFVFGDYLTRIFEAVLFLFVTHPFDVGDRCKIDGEQMVVEEIKLLDTIFLRHDKQKTTISNSVLTSKMITNYNRSPDMEDEILFSIHLATPAAKIAMMKERIKSCISSKEKHWYPKPTIICMDTEDLNKLRFKVLLVHRMNQQHMKKRLDRRGRLVEKIAEILKELDI
ncbi:hypothetical protein SLA2020_182030 [Shorea laevis]